MAEKRTEVIRHRVWNEELQREEIVEKTFIYNESPDGQIKYITYDWCVNRAKGADYKRKPTFATDFRKREEQYEYEDPQGNTHPIVAIAGKFKNEHTYIYTFTQPNEDTFDVVIAL